MNYRYPIEAWQITEKDFQLNELRESESVFALANGFIGMRGNLEEQTATGAETIQGSFLNGVFDTEPIVYGEAAYGYAKNHETICNVMDAKSLILEADGERLDMGKSRVTEHQRVLDLRGGILTRRFVWETKSGCTLKVEQKRLVSLTHRNLAATALSLQCLRGSCRLTLESAVRPAVIAEGDPNDPRNAAGKDRRLLCSGAEVQGAMIALQQKTKNSGFTVSCAADHRGSIAFTAEAGKDGVSWIGKAALQSGDSLRLEKSICYTASGKDEADSWEEAMNGCREAPGFDKLAEEQRAYLDAFWERAGIDIEGDDALLQGLRFNLFHLLQSVGRDGRRNIAAKGLTGEGYEGHTFWDTEAYILPVFLYTEPELARKLLEYRYTTLPQARERARVMGHPKGALFPWRTIDGEECSAYFPAGTAQVHIDGDIAHAVWEYWQATGDLAFLSEMGAEILAETARLFADIGFFSEEKNGRFVINCVTGPDEYNVMVNNNVYTNSVAEENLRNAAAAMQILKAECPREYAALCTKIGFSEEEAAFWQKAAEGMYYPPAQDGIVPQDDGFLARKPWPLESIPAEKHPLLMHYHGLTIYRHMVCKQADLILAMILFGDRYTEEEKKKNFAFYDSVTTHDSSLSMAVFSILAAEIGEIRKACDYFLSSARLDLDNIHHNTKDGLHMANMAGTWIGMTRGFGGMRIRDGMLSFAPVCPPEWESFSFCVCFRGRIIRVHADHSGASYELKSGDAITILSCGKPVTLS
ncbi:MAG: glycoside hydrolase family 65 protein [Oscillospiraceae bacterium]|nr:glycoside hydrolase family 65 protein [Oscillospiraceae bacterium]